MVQTPTHLDSDAMLCSLMPAVELPAPAPASAPADEAWRCLSAAFESALSELSPEERVFLKMRLLHGCTVSEIARAFHFEARSFRRRFHELLVTMQRLIAVAPPMYH